MFKKTARIPNEYPLVLTATLGALNDNLIKAALIVFAALTVPADQAASIGLLASGLLMLPFVLFSGWAGTIADKFEKASMIRVVKYSELVLSVLATAAMWFGHTPSMLVLVFLMGTQSAFFGPLKLGWLPERLPAQRLVRANGWLETFTFLGILGGTVTGGLLAGPDTLIWAGFAAIGVALLGILAARILPVTEPAAPGLHFPKNPFAGNSKALKALFADKTARQAAFLLTWFWAAGSVYLSTLPAYLRLHLGADETLITVVLALFAGGIGFGSWVAGHTLKGKVATTTLLPACAIISAAAVAVWVGFDKIEAGSGLQGLLGTPEGLFVTASLFLVALGGGLFVVPLGAVIQSRAEAGGRGRMMAGLNILKALGITLCSGLIAVAVSLGLELSATFLMVAISALSALAASVVFFPRAAIQSVTRAILTRLLRVEIDGAEYLATKGPVVFVSNHISFLDGPLLFSLIEREADIAVNTGWANQGFLNTFAKTLKIAPVDPENPMAAKRLAQTIQKGGSALVFPEGRISTHGNLMKVYPGTAWLVDSARAPVVRITLEGLESSIFNRKIPGMARSFFPKVKVTVSAPEKLKIEDTIKGGARRDAATSALQTLLEEGRFKALSAAATIPEMFAKGQRSFDSKLIAVSDPLGNSLTRRRMSIGAAAFSHLLRTRTEPNERVGVLLPSVAGASVVLLGLWRAGRVAAILNPTLGPAPMLSSIETGHLKRILTSRDFVEKAELQDVIAYLEDKGIEIIWTDDLRAEIGIGEKVRAAIAARHPTDVQLSGTDPAVVLFTSGTEGAPKGVVLSHGNLTANIAQLRARTDVSTRDRVLSAMPLFHSFGLTGGLLFPLMTGAPVMLYPTPLHYRIVPEMAYSHQATVIFGTDTFLSGWGRRAASYDFSSVRAAIAGAEPVKDETRALWSEKFGVRILEGYGATEAGPVIALNTPMENRAGTVGCALPHIEMRLEAVPGINGQRLWVKGPNVMAGYLMPGGDGTPEAPENGWYDTGDIIQTANDGFISIVGRVKRFAKVGGEMVSLAAAEVLASSVWPEAHVAAISVSDARKGERVLLATTQAGATRKNLSSAAREAGIAEITVPSDVLVMEAIPLLASGKTDYPSLTRIIAQEKHAALAS